MPSLISLTWGCTSLMRSCSILDNFSMRLPCSRSWANRMFCLAESRCIHQKQTPQQIVPAKVIQKAKLFSFIIDHLVMHASFVDGRRRDEVLGSWETSSIQGVLALAMARRPAN